MRLWIGVHLPLLSLETFRPSWSEPGLYAVIDHKTDHETVRISSPIAAQAGVQAGMRRASATAIAPDLLLLERDEIKEQMAVNAMALTLLHYTPEVTLAEDNVILFDVTASLGVFGGRLALCRHIKQSIAALGFTAHISCAPTARGAWLLAHYTTTSTTSRIRRTLKMASMIKRLDVLPCELLPAAQPHHEWLRGIGCHSIGDLRQLPRAGLQRRTHLNLLQEIDQAYGLAPELFVWFKAPETFHAKLDMPDRTDHAEALLFASRRLIVQLTGWLVSSHKAVLQITLWLVHERGRYAIPATSVDICLAEPTWHEAHLIQLLRERLNRIQLIAPVISMRLETTHLTPMLPPTDSLFPDPGGTPADFSRLLELLKARLGDDGVLIPAPVADHRPEARNHWVTATIETIPAPAQKTMQSNQSNFYPCFLLAHPIALPMQNHRPFYGSPLRLIQGPERIETGWWDNQPAVRDYFIAQDSNNVCYWIYQALYQERTQQEARWFLHGLFA